MISDDIYDDIVPQMKILNMIIPIIMHFCKPHKAAYHPIKCVVINDAKQFLTVYHILILVLPLILDFWPNHIIQVK